MNKCTRRLLRIFSLVLFLTPLSAGADGLLVPPPEYWVTETNQEAVVFFEDGREDLILSTEFRGNAADFAWIVPTPSQPTVERGSWEIFSALREITQKQIDDSTLSGIGRDFSAEAYVDQDAVREIERKSVAYYDIVVLEARTTVALLQWFTDNGFAFPEDSAYIVEDYINAGWYFTAVKLNAKSTSSTSAVRTGQSIPLHFAFETPKMVFPLQLSQVANAYQEQTPKRISEDVGITLYLIADTKLSLPEFTQQYAGYVSGEAVRELSFTTNGEPMLNATNDQRYVVTKLYRTFPISEMTYDLYPRQEENSAVLNDEGLIAERTKNLWILSTIGGLLVVLLVGTIVIMNRTTIKQSS